MSNVFSVLKYVSQKLQICPSVYPAHIHQALTVTWSLWYPIALTPLSFFRKEATILVIVTLVTLTLWPEVLNEKVPLKSSTTYTWLPPKEPGVVVFLEFTPTCWFLSKKTISKYTLSSETVTPLLIVSEMMGG